MMVIGEKLKALRAQKNMMQGDVEQRTGLLRCYISRVENGHTVPSVDTLEKMARALQVPMYRLFTDEDHIKKPNMPAEIWIRLTRPCKTPLSTAAFTRRPDLTIDDSNHSLAVRLICP
jgi:transcriptional regulator with XRE-family HTH domain